jgi:hypothetical protein
VLTNSLQLSAVTPAFARPRITSAPMSAAQGTAVPFTGRSAAVVALDATDGDTQGSPPREAPV